MSLGQIVENTYKHYFDIDENYYASVSQELLEGGFVDWNSFYPHETFVNLLTDTIRLLRRDQNRSIWVEGAYGTGKSHAVLTLKKILDAGEDEVLKYFKDNGLEMDLFNKLQGAKAQGEILTVHRVGSSNIRSDNALIMAIQEEIKKAIEQKGLEFNCEDSLKDSIVKWLSDDINSKNFNNYIEGRYREQFGSDRSEDIVKKLMSLENEKTSDLVRKIFDVAEKENIIAMKIDADDLGVWIKNIIEKNNLKSIVFIWDEFTEYFLNNRSAITGFQTLAELSNTISFNFVIVTHTSTGLFNEKDDSRKIIDRFMKPTCEIILPDNMAFKLMARAMKISDDEVVKKEWDINSEDLFNQIPKCSQMVIKSSKIDEIDLKKILPIHPYTSIMLKHLAAMFGSNQRSMFEFIKDKKDDEDDRSFSWYINNHGIFSDDNLLTIDMLWAYFYSDGKANLEAGLRTLLNTYDMSGNSEKLSEEKKRVFKTILLLQGISERNYDKVELFKPTAKNIFNAYEGTNLGDGKSLQIAEILVKDGLIFKNIIANNEPQFVAMRSGSNVADVTNYIGEYRKDKKIKSIIDDYSVLDFMPFIGALKLRYDVNFVTVDDITRVVNGIKQKQYENSIPVVITFAKNASESAVVIAKIRELVVNNEQNLIFVDTSLCDLSDDLFEAFIKNLAEEKYWRGKDNVQADQYKANASAVISNWKEKLKDASYRIVTKESESKVYGIVELDTKLREFNTKIFELGIENFKVTTTMFDITSARQGAKCGLLQEVSGSYRSSNEATKLETALKGVWALPDGIEPNKNHLVYRIKIKLDKLISEYFEKSGKISIAEIYNFLKREPFGFMPCNLTAFMLGFLLKEYANDKFRWSNEQVSEDLSVEKMAEMIEEIIKQQLNSSGRYVDKYIVLMTGEEREFLSNTASVFGIEKEKCASVEKTRELLRSAIKRIGLPLWSINVKLETEKPTDYEVQIEIVKNYCLLANNSGSGKTDNDIAIEIGKIFLENKGIDKKLRTYMNAEYCKKGMTTYLATYKHGELKTLADEIGCFDNTLMHLKSKDVESGSWLWNKDETINAEIDKIIIEYKIVIESNKFTSKSTSYKTTIAEWASFIQNLKLPYETIKNDKESLKALLDCLNNIFTTKTLSESNKLKFLEELQINGKDFMYFYSNQVLSFKEKCKFDLNGLSDNDISNIFAKMTSGMFNRSNSEFQNAAKIKIDEYRKTILRDEAKKLWIEKTNTSSPREWSDNFKTPILALADDEYETSKKSFETLMQINSSDSEIKSAIAFLKQASIFDKMNSEQVRDDAFLEKVIGKRLMIRDVNETREQISLRITSSCYDWYPKTKQIENILDDYNKSLYEKTGCDEALSVIELMSEADVKLYLKKLIKERIEVGMEILKDK